MRKLSIRCLLVPAVAALAACAGAPDGAPEPTSSSSAATTVCGQTSVKGIDVSHYDGTIDWATAKASGIDFAIAKATESTTYVDPTFATNWAGMKAHGVVRAAYHFFRANADPIAQANHVMQTVGTLEPSDLPIVLDLETTDGQTGATIAANALKFLAAVTQGTGKKAIVYTSPGFIAGLSGTSGFASYTLWVANWGVTCPNVPSPWSTWVFWQNADNGTVSGVPATAVDLDYFNGTLAELHAFAGAPPADAGAHDSGRVNDGGGSDGGGASSDGGMSSDGAPTTDDGGVTSDGSTAPDAAHAGRDAGAGEPPADVFGQSGGCAVSRGATGEGASAAVVALVVVAARRRRRAGQQ